MKDQTQPMLSVVVPAYNAEQFIATAIESFLQQQVDWAEMIIVDDGSADQTFAQCEPYLSEKIKYFKTVNLGAGHARNYGMERAGGKWIGFVDSDDLICSGVLHQVYDLLATGTGDIIYCGKMTTDMEMTTEPEISEPENVEDIPNKIPQLEFWTSFYRKSYLDENNIRFFEYREQDIETAFRFRAFSKTDRIDVHKEIALILHRNNPTSNTNTWNVAKMNRIKSKVYGELFEEYSGDDIDISGNLYKTYLRCFWSFVVNSFRSGVQKEKKSELKGYIKELSNGLKGRKKVVLPFKQKTKAIILKVLSKSFFTNIFVAICKAKKAPEHK